MDSIQILKRQAKYFGKHEKSSMAATASAIEVTLAMMSPETRNVIWDVLKNARKLMGRERFEDEDDYFDFVEENLDR